MTKHIKLTSTQERAIHDKLVSGKYTKVALGKEYGKSPRTIGRIFDKVSKLLEKEVEEPKQENKKALEVGDVVLIGTGDELSTGYVDSMLKYRGTVGTVERIDTSSNTPIRVRLKDKDYWNFKEEHLTLVEKPSIEVGTLLVGNSRYNITNEDAVVKVVSTSVDDAEKFNAIRTFDEGGDLIVKVISNTNEYYKCYISQSYCVSSKNFTVVGSVTVLDEAPVEAPVEAPLVSYNITAMAIALTVNDDSYVIDLTHPNFTATRTAILEDRINDAIVLMNVSKAITDFSEGKLEIKDGEVLFEGQVIQGALVDKIIGLMGEGEVGFKPLALFLERVLQNPSFKTRNRLMEFAAASDIGIHTDGRLVAFKNTREDGCSSRGGKWVQDSAGKWSHDSSLSYKHALGEVLTMPRSEVDDNESNTCSSGLHVCSAYYLKSMWGTRGATWKVAVCPSDIVAIPPDYKNSKARTCRYEVIEDVTGTTIEDVVSSI